MLDDRFNIKFVDFGFAAEIQGSEGSLHKTILGTLAFMAPEIH